MRDCLACSMLARSFKNLTSPAVSLPVPIRAIASAAVTSPQCLRLPLWAQRGRCPRCGAKLQIDGAFSLRSGPLNSEASRAKAPIKVNARIAEDATCAAYILCCKLRNNTLWRSDDVELAKEGACRTAAPVSVD